MCSVNGQRYCVNVKHAASSVFVGVNGGRVFIDGRVLMDGCVRMDVCRGRHVDVCRGGRVWLQVSGR